MWSEFGTCSVTCGGGTQIRTVLMEAANGGEPCPGSDTLTCNEDPCECIDKGKTKFCNDNKSNCNYASVMEKCRKTCNKCDGGRTLLISATIHHYVVSL